MRFAQPHDRDGRPCLPTHHPRSRPPAPSWPTPIPRRALKEPRDRHLRRGRAVRICHPLKFLRSREPARPERKPWKKGDSVPLAALQDVMGALVANAVATLDRDEVDYRACPLALGHAHVRDADHPNLSLSLEVHDGPERLLDADTRGQPCAAGRDRSPRATAS